MWERRFDCNNNDEVIKEMNRIERRWQYLEYLNETSEDKKMPLGNSTRGMRSNTLATEMRIAMSEETNQPSSSTSTSSTEKEQLNVQLDKTLLASLDSDTPIRFMVGSSVNSEIADKLNNTLSKGISNQTKKLLFSQYPIPINLHNLFAPMLNPELKAILPENVNKQDLYIFRHQQQISSALAAMTKSIYHLTRSGQLGILEPINDACILLCDVFYNETEMRRSFILNTVNEQINKAISDTIPDKFLFGENISEILKKVQKTLPGDVEQNEESNMKREPFFIKNPNEWNPYRKVSGCDSTWLRELTWTTYFSAASSNVTEYRAPISIVPVPFPLTYSQTPQYACRLKYFSLQWERIINNSIISSWVRGYKIPFRWTPPPSNVSSQILHSPQVIQEFNACLRKLLNIGAISVCNHEDNEYISNALYARRSNGDNQFILNLKYLNKFVLKTKFKFNDYRAIIELVKPNCYMAIIELKDAYFLFPVHKDYTKYLKFKINNILYKFNCLTVGLSTARYVLNTLINLVLEHMKLTDVTVYVDDKLLCCGRTYEECKQNVMSIKNTLENLGFIINDTNNTFTPSTIIQTAGFIFNSVNMSISLTDMKRQKIHNLLKKFVKNKTCTLREFTSLTSTLMAASPAVNYSWLYTKRFEPYRKLCFYNNSSYDRSITIPDCIRDDMIWWLFHVKTDHGKIKIDTHSLEIFSDASLTGWGAFCCNTEAFGHWKSNEGYSDNINVLELKAAFLALKTFAKYSYNTTILLRIDNTAAISCINKMGCEKYQHLDEISRQMWQWCERRNLFISAIHVTSKNNVVADALSRMKFQDPEYELADYAFNEIAKKFGTPTIDIFASQSNAKCSEFVSKKDEPTAWAVDAFSLRWSHLNFYAFPPFYLVWDVLRKIVSDQAEGIVVVPDWPKEPWFPLFNKLKCSDVIFFESDNESVIAPIRNHHNRNRSVRLIAAKLSAKR